MTRRGAFCCIAAFTLGSSVARAETRPAATTQLLEADRDAKVTVDGDRVTVESKAQAFSPTCGPEPRISVEEGGKLREAMVRLPARGNYWYRGKRAMPGMCDMVLCQGAFATTIQLREYRKTGERERLPVFALAPLDGKVRIEVPLYRDDKCSQPITLHATVVHHPGADERPVDDETIAAAITRAGYDAPSQLTRAPDPETGPQVIAATSRAGSPRTVFVTAIGGTVSAPLEVAQGKRDVVFGPSLGELAEVDLTEQDAVGSHATIALVAPGPPPVLRCSMPGGSVRREGGHTIYTNLTLEPGADARSFFVTTQRQVDGNPPSVERTPWRMTDKGCAPVK